VIKLAAWKVVEVSLQDVVKFYFIAWRCPEFALAYVVVVVVVALYQPLAPAVYLRIAVQDIHTCGQC
jgi:hypothetical protein